MPSYNLSQTKSLNQNVYSNSNIIRKLSFDQQKSLSMIQQRKKEIIKFIEEKSKEIYNSLSKTDQSNGYTKYCSYNMNSNNKSYSSSSSLLYSQLFKQKSSSSAYTKNIDPLYTNAFKIIKKKIKYMNKKPSLTYEFKSKNKSYRFFIYENESEVIKFPKYVKNKLRDNNGIDNDFETEDEHLENAIKTSYEELGTAIKKAKNQICKRRKYFSLISRRKYTNSSHVEDVILKNLKKLDFDGNNNFKQKNKIENECDQNNKFNQYKSSKHSFSSRESSSNGYSKNNLLTVSYPRKLFLNPKYVENNITKKNDIMRERPRRTMSIMSSKYNSQKKDINILFHQRYKKRSNLGYN